ncbi:MAG TPA: outer membrane protein assembly factor BamE [Gammaproteobacteria bacterium]|nr:outer membrane protein assembly factor BamE [Gammaproteobacteria bacterium]
MIKLLISLSVIASINLTGCTRLFTVHTIDIQQGNALDTADVAKIHTGMTRTEVSEILGEPVLSNAFTTKHWDYVYYLKKPDLAPEEKKLVVYFTNDEVTRLEQ